jgi:hypothetical protein
MKTSLLRFVALLLGWGSLATIAGATHLLGFFPPVAVPVLVASLTVGLTFAQTRVGWIAEAIGTLSTRSILAAHLVRFVGIYFLWLHGQGRLPMEFAYRAGWGDIAAAIGALVFLLWPATLRVGWAFTLWNIFGLLDLLVAVGTGGWLNFTRPGSMVEIASLPLTLVPLWLVPMLISSHVLLLRRRSGPEHGKGISARALNAR